METKQEMNQSNLELRGSREDALQWGFIRGV